MDYKELLGDREFNSPEEICEWMDSAATAITDLLARAEAVEAGLKQRETYYNQMVDALSATDSFEKQKLCEEADHLKDLLKEAETRAEKAERERDEYFKHLQGFCFCCAHRTDGFDCKAKCYGHKRGSAWVYAGAAKEE